MLVVFFVFFVRFLGSGDFVFFRVGFGVGSLGLGLW